MEIISTDGRRLERVSRWIELKHNYHPSKRNSLWDYVTDGSGNRPSSEKFNPDDGLFLDYFRHNGKTYALEQFGVLGGVWVGGTPVMYHDKDGKLGVIGTVDMDGNMYSPLYAEWDEYCERVRLYVMKGEER